MPNTPAHLIITNSIHDHYFNNSPRLHSSLGYRVRKLLDYFNNPQINVIKSVLYNLPPYALSVEPPCPGIMGVVKSSMPKQVIKDMFVDHTKDVHSEISIYTDGSKSEEGVGFGVVLPDRTVSRRLPGAASIFSAELQAILFALACLVRISRDEYVIYSDSRSAIISITDAFSKHPIVMEIHRWIDILCGQGKTVRFCWVPSHTGVTGNEAADVAAVEAVTSNLPIPDRPLPYRDYYPFFNALLKERWADAWRNITDNKLRSLKDTIEPWNTAYRKNRSEERVMCRLRIGHTKLTHGHLMCGDPIPYCENCLVHLTVHHALVECSDYVAERNNYWSPNGLTLKKILSNNEDKTRKVLAFLRDTDLYNKI